jgi:hypothetical protein
MIVAIGLILLAFLLYLFGGWLRGLFEGVILFDSVDDWFGPFWAFDLFASDKDRNDDGKVSFWELNFPKDGGHRAKLYELCCYAAGAGALAMGFSMLDLKPWYVLALVVPLWWVNSVGFLLSFNKYRHVKK